MLPRGCRNALNITGASHPSAPRGGTRPGRRPLRLAGRIGRRGTPPNCPAAWRRPAASPVLACEAAPTRKDGVRRPYMDAISTLTLHPHVCMDFKPIRLIRSRNSWSLSYKQICVVAYVSSVRERNGIMRCPIGRMDCPMSIINFFEMRTVID